MEHSNANVAGITERLTSLIGIKHDEVLFMEKEIMALRLERCRMKMSLEKCQVALKESEMAFKDSGLEDIPVLRKKVAELEKELAFQTESKRVFKQDMIAAQEKLRAMTITG